MAPRLLSFFGTDRTRYAAAVNAQSFCGSGYTEQRQESSRLYAAGLPPV
jgi:hypothetical protein